MSAVALPSVELLVRVEHEGAVEERRLVVTSGVVTIGRDKRCTVPLPTGFASRQHVSVDVRDLADGTMAVTDTSMNGTSVGRSIVKQSTVRTPAGTPLGVGPFVIVIDRTESPRPAPPSPPAALQLVPEAAPRWEAENAVRTEIHKLLLEHLDLAAVDIAKYDDPTLRPRVLAALRTIVTGLGDRIPADVDRDLLVGSLLDEAIGLGPVERFLSDPTVNEIMVVDPDTIFLEKGGKLVRADARFTNDDRVRATIERIVTPLGRRIDESVPLVDARLADGSRVNAVIRPLALRGAAITIRKFGRQGFSMARLVELGALTERMGQFLLRSVIAKKNIVISGGTGSGKTTLLNVLSGAIPADERIITIEDAAELQLRQPHVVSLETRPANMEGKGEYSIRDLVKNALRMRPDRIVVGECRGGEALDMLQAMNTGHDGSLTTTHANSPREAVARLETLVLMAGLDLPVRAIREQIAGSVQLIVQQSRLSDGTRRVTAISEVVGIGDRGDVELVPIFEFVRTGTGAHGKVLGEYRATGFLPTYLDQFLLMGLVGEDEDYL
ncbi:MAG: Type secretion system hydrolase TadA/VirB11/CpaF, TadA subfamily [Labilithrix sp.]|nr:Type secretion system hydrolase TadA/VirB11/CpaF, TadA subfamily [Labilithrix sp.]